MKLDEETAVVLCHDILSWIVRVNMMPRGVLDILDKRLTSCGCSVQVAQMIRDLIVEIETNGAEDN